MTDPDFAPDTKVVEGDRQRKRQLRRLESRLEIAVDIGAMDEAEAEEYRQLSQGFSVAILIEVVLMIAKIIMDWLRDRDEE